jgi:hypothetical protein
MKSKHRTMIRHSWILRENHELVRTFIVGIADRLRGENG